MDLALSGMKGLKLMRNGRRASSVVGASGLRSGGGMSEPQLGRSANVFLFRQNASILQWLSPPR